MTVTMKELRIQPGKIIDHAAHGEEIIVLYHKKACAKIVPLNAKTSENNTSDESIFGMWGDHAAGDDVESIVRAMRKGRQF